MIGVAASSCVKDILCGKVQTAEVEKIYSPLDFSDPDIIEAFLEQCQADEWKSNPAEGRRIFFQLYMEGKIARYRPKSNGYPLVQTDSCWVATEAEITWRRM